MADKRILLKISHKRGMRPFASSRFGAGGTQFSLTPLFEVPATARVGLSLEDNTTREHRWYLAKVSAGEALGLSEDANNWDIAHRALSEEFGAGADARLLALEPDIEQIWPLSPPPRLQGAAIAQLAPCEPEKQKGDPLASGPGFAWHLEKRFTTLRDARNAVMRSGDDVMIVHLDTGYDPKHKTLPVNLNKAKQKNFVQGEPPNDAVDRTPPQGLLKNRGHGTGTLGILAGGKLTGMRPPEANTNDYLGGAPLAQVVPVRIANSVVHFWTSSVAQGINYAREIKADVVSMSMGGLPSNAWADAVNAAYEAGIVIVCAAGNNFNGWPTSSIVWPAAFQRVIAACGIMADGRPYFNLPPWVMQGCYGPLSKMATAMATFTPNIPWPKIDCHDAIDLDGAGTSSATPQIAAAAALWLRKYKKDLKYSEPWMRVEAVRHALFSTGDKGGSEPHEFFGQGILHANAALGVAPATANTLTRTPVDHASFSFFGASADLGLGADPRRTELYRLELTQLATKAKGASEAIPDPGEPASRISDRQRRRFLEAILDDGNCSNALRQHLEAELGRSSTVIVSEAPKPSPPVGKRTSRVAKAPIPLTGSLLPRQTRLRPPARRRLQIFAVDPSLSNRLETAFINKTVVDIPWEANLTHDNLLQPGPVGEYVEVIDVDPASGCVYEPVDLNDPFLLAQNGLAPSEGNPRFHQQMVYAVSMRTIDTFEAALGRRVLWSQKRIRSVRKDPATRKQVTHYEEIYIPRLRIYPHALRQANAYYSPDKTALLFGYFPELRYSDGSETLGGMVFTCLSHDIVAHETTHALLDGMHRRYQEASNVDVLAFHEAFADIIAIFQHFTLAELLRFEISRTRGDLRKGQYLADLARQFGEAIGRSKALRSAIGVDPATTNYATTTEPHERGSVLVAAVFDAFLKIYERRIDDLLRIATGGSGVLRPGALHPNLVERLAAEAVKSAQHVLRICIRALDYCPPVDITFSDYLRALITADADLVGIDRYGYRVAFLESFRSRGIYPNEIRTLSVESLQWASPLRQPQGFSEALRTLRRPRNRNEDRREIYRASKDNAVILHEWLAQNLSAEMASHFGLNRSAEKSSNGTDPYERDDNGRPRFEVHSVRVANRVTPDGEIKNEMIIVVTQRRNLNNKHTGAAPIWFRGGCTLVVDPANDTEPIRYAVLKSIFSRTREDAQRKFLGDDQAFNLRSLYFDTDSRTESKEPFALLHIGH
jgi:hypothetical protein